MNKHINSYFKAHPFLTKIETRALSRPNSNNQIMRPFCEYEYTNHNPQTISNIYKVSRFTCGWNHRKLYLYPKMHSLRHAIVCEPPCRAATKNEKLRC